MNYTCIVCIVSSKQRSKLRDSIATEKKRMSTLIVQYNENFVVHNRFPCLSMEDALSGEFPWSIEGVVYRS